MAAPTLHATQTSATTGTSLTVTVPGAAEPGDLLAVTLSGKSSAAVDALVSSPGGLTLVHHVRNDEPSSTHRTSYRVYYMIADDPVPESFTWTWSGSGSRRATVAVIRGHDPSDPVPEALLGVDRGTSSPATAPAMTTTRPSLIGRAFAGHSAPFGVSFPLPTGHVNWSNESVEPRRVSSLSQADAGLTAQASVSISSEMTSWMGVSFVIQPASETQLVIADPWVVEIGAHAGTTTGGTTAPAVALPDPWIVDIAAHTSLAFVAPKAVPDPWVVEAAAHVGASRRVGDAQIAVSDPWTLLIGAHTGTTTGGVVIIPGLNGDMAFTLVGVGRLTQDVTVAEPPEGVTTRRVKRVSEQYPTPVLVDGKPT